MLSKATTFADGIAVRVPVPEAFDSYSRGAERIVAITGDEIRAAIRALYRTGGNIDAAVYGEIISNKTSALTSPHRPCE